MKKISVGRGQELSPTLLSGWLTDSSGTSPSFRSDERTGSEKASGWVMITGIHKSLYIQWKRLIGGSLSNMVNELKSHW